MRSKRLTQADQSHILGSLPTGRRWQMELCPIEDVQWREFYEYHQDPILVDAVHAIEGVLGRDTDSLVEHHNNITITIDMGDLYRDTNLNFTRRLPYQRHWQEGNKLFPTYGADSGGFEVSQEHPRYNELVAWAKRAMRMRVQDHIMNTVSRDIITQICNTSGQVKAVWPGILNFLPKEVAAGLGNARRDSRVPDGVKPHHRFWIPHINFWMTQSMFLADSPTHNSLADASENPGGYTTNLPMSVMSEIMHDAVVGIDPFGIVS